MLPKGHERLRTKLGKSLVVYKHGEPNVTKFST